MDWEHVLPVAAVMGLASLLIVVPPWPNTKQCARVLRQWTITDPRPAGHNGVVNAVAHGLTPWIALPCVVALLIVAAAPKRLPLVEQTR